MFRNIRNIQDVPEWGLCIGCGACYAACEKKGVSLVSVEAQGVRPRFESDVCSQCTECLDICPGYFLDARNIPSGLTKVSEADHEFGPVLEIWEGYAADPEIRYQASSGGILSALALFCIEQKGMSYVLHTGMDKNRPWLNQTIRSKTRGEIIAHTGSRYAPSSPCDALADCEKDQQPFVFIGKPCDAAGAYMLRKKRPDLDKAIGLSLSFFCAGTPSAKGTLDLIQSMSVPVQKVSSIRYRGNGWPGNFEVTYGPDQKHAMSYPESWGRLTKYRPFRCNLCPDGLGRFADITSGDAWHKHSEQSPESGHSLVLVRTEKGREMLHEAMRQGYVRLSPSNSKAVLAAQNNLLERRRELFGRLAGMALTGMPIPKFVGFSLYHSWKLKSLFEKMKIIAGTAKRVIRRKMWKRQPIQWESAQILPFIEAGKGNAERDKSDCSSSASL